MNFPLNFASTATLLGIFLLLAGPIHSNHFASQLYSQASHGNHHRNIVLSPATTNMALGLVFFGMRDCPELTQVLDTMRHGDLATDVIKMVNRLYVDRNIQLMPAYQEAIYDDRMGKPAKTVDFSDPHVASEEINSFVRILTDNKIQQFIHPGLLDKDTKMAIANAAYFHGQWAKTKYTKRLPFYTLNGTELLVDTLETYDVLRYGSIDSMDAHVVELPYQGELSMVIILPRHRGQSLASLSSLIRNVDLVPLTENLTKEFVHLQLPKFQVETRLPLETILRPLGVKTIFHAPVLNKIIASRDKNHKIGTIMHFSSIEVSESGRGYSPLMMVNQQMDRQPHKFWANHPFIFAIKDANHIYFMGHVVAPV
ncbi:serine protease inhibitor 42Dd-like isoform X2 [Drosophila obscura]|uniref:serine protease inhibitor 42Dd-like isoform X2 n=1 Tax=Drosophila obscura TaxID=7282 RepID=UPI001BB24505|nr:serine protease inhibitor 42Dd-like isoform X2 [Drosophila obscura]